MLTPEGVGLTSYGRRRTPGLRREEVAQLAGIGTAWYTFLEQGRNVRVSIQVVERLSSVFSLNPEERRYLYQLAFGALPDDETVSGKVTEDLLAILSALNPHAAYVLDQRFDMLAWNDAGTLVFDYSPDTPAPMRNVIRRLVCDPKKRKLHEHYEQHVRNTIAAFRPHFSRHAHDAQLRELVNELECASTDFRRWWSQHEVLDSDRLSMPLALRHPRFGRITGRFTFLAIFGRPDLTLCVFTLDQTGERLVRTALAARSTARGSAP